MAIKVGGTEVITNSRELSNIASIDAATVTALEAVITTDPTLGTLTQSFGAGESAVITLSSSVSPTAVVAVTKEIGQTGVSSKGAWDVNTTASNYELYDEAPATSLTLEGWDISTASYSQSFSVAAQDATPYGVFFKPDGLKMYVVGTTNDSVYEYDLSTAWDVSTTSYLQNFSVAAQEDQPHGIHFKPDGTKMYIIGFTGDDVNEYDLSTAWDISTASYVQNFSVAAQDTVPAGVFFKPDGLKMYITGLAGGDINEYSLSVAWDVSTATYSQNFSVAAQITEALSAFFRSDGLKMYVIDNGLVEDVNEYDLSTAWDISTASYVQNFSIAGQETDARGLFFKPDGTKMYIAGGSGDDVNEYDIPLKATLGTGSFSSSDVGKRIFVDDGGEAILTATDGSHSLVSAFGASSYTSGNWSLTGLDVDATDGITLSGAVTEQWGVSSASFVGSFDPSAQEIAPSGIFFKPDGTKMFILGLVGDDVNEYNLSTAWDTSTASYVQNFSVSSQDPVAIGMFFSTDGTNMYIAGTSSSNLHQYSLSTAWNLSTASFTRTYTTADPNGIFFKSDGLKMYTTNSNLQSVREFNLSTAWNISTASHSQNFSVSAQETNPSGIFFKSDGTKMFVSGYAGDDVNEYDLSTAWDISTASYSQNFSVSAQNANPRDLFFKPDGTRMYVAGGVIGEYNTTVQTQPTAQYLPAITSPAGQIDSQYWTDINSMTADDADNSGEVYYAVSTDDRTTWSVAKASDGVRDIVRNNGGTWEYNSAVGSDGGKWDISAASYSQTFSVASQETLLRDVAFSSDGTKMYVLGQIGDDVNEYDLSTAWDVSTASFNQSFSYSGQSTDSDSLFFKADGTKMYILDSGDRDINEYTLSTAWDVSTASYTTQFAGLSNSGERGMFFKSDGTKMYVVGNVDQNVKEYNLSTAWLVSTASYSQSFSVSAQDTYPSAIHFKSDGTKMYVLGAAGLDVNEYTLSTAWDVSTASYSQNFSISSQEAGPEGLFFKSDGSKMYVAGHLGDDVNEYSLSADSYTTSTTWNSATTNNEFAALAEALGATAFNQMNKAQIDAVTDGSHFTLGDTLDLAIVPYLASAGTAPTSDGMSINYDAAALNKGAILGTDYDYDVPAGDKVRITALAANNLKVRIV